MADIQTYLDDIQSAVYGKDVRQAICDAIEAIDTKVKNSDVGVLGTEVEDIRTGSDGTIYESAGESVRSQVEKVKSYASINIQTTNKNLIYQTERIDLAEEKIEVLEAKKYDLLCNTKSYDTCTLSKSAANYDKLKIRYCIEGTNDVIVGETEMSTENGVSVSDFLPLQENTNISVEMFSSYISYTSSSNSLSVDITRMTIGDDNSIQKGVSNIFKFESVYGIKY